MAQCFECGRQATNDHHVVPESRGGKRTVPLCDRCHRLAHGYSGDADSQPLGRPPAYSKSIRKRYLSLRAKGWTPSQIAHLFNAEEIPCLGKRWRYSSFEALERWHRGA